MNNAEIKFINYLEGIDELGIIVTYKGKSYAGLLGRKEDENTND